MLDGSSRLLWFFRCPIKRTQEEIKRTQEDKRSNSNHPGNPVKHLQDKVLPDSLLVKAARQFARTDHRLWHGMIVLKPIGS